MSGEDDLSAEAIKKQPTEDFNNLDFVENDLDSKEEEEEEDEEFLLMLQDLFQDEVVDSLFCEFSDYIQTNALPICGFLNRDGIEKIIDKLQSTSE